MDNWQAIGYMLLACKEAELDKDTVKKLYQNMYRQFDLKTEKEAEEQGYAWYHSFGKERDYE
ncbi:MAG: hypothetical protein ABF649_23220 [Bacillus sp. (in: firmicutes)]